MTRPRVPRASAIAGAIARVLGMGASVVLLANLIYESVNWGKTLALSVTVVRHFILFIFFHLFCLFMDEDDDKDEGELVSEE